MPINYDGRIVRDPAIAFAAASAQEDLPVSEAHVKRRE
jgi:hypothetical protein